MYIQLNRLKDNGKSTIGTVFVNGTFECFSLEDTHNEPKVYGKTRIQSGVYDIKLRNEGGMNNRYRNKYGEVHKGMLWLQNVDNFEWVYIHIGNTEDDTDGCLLFGNTCVSNESKQSIQGSALAYMSFYKKVINSIDNNEDITIEII
jgi:hypothetical protein